MAVVGRVKNGELAVRQLREGYPLKNLIPNGSFETSSSWSGVTYDTSQPLHGQQCSKLAAGTSFTRMNTCAMPKPLVGHVYYGRHSLKTSGNATPADCRFEWFAGDGAGLNFVFGWNRGNHPDWFTESTRLTVTTVTGGTYICRNFAVNPNVDIWCDGLMIVDLTEAFGAGQEPDQAWCDSNIPFFGDRYWIPAVSGIHGGEYRTPRMEEGSACSIGLTKTTASLFRECIALKNLVPGGDMAGTHWSLPSGVSYDTTRYKYGAQSMKVTASSTVSEVCIANKTNLILKQSHLYYGRMETYQEAAVGGCNIYWPIAEPSFGGAGVKPAGSWQASSWLVNRTTFTDGVCSMRLDFDNVNIAGTMWIDGVMIVDLTEAFGVGREPGKAWCDATIPYFDGTMEFSLEGNQWLY